MSNFIKLNLFYDEPNPDRWLKFDSYIRNFIRKIIRGKPRVSGQRMVAINLMKGLDELGIPYRYNDYNYAKKNTEELIGVIGKTFLLKEKKFKNPILFGASLFSHPFEFPNLMEHFPNIKKILVPGDWMRKMFIPYYGGIVESWPVGIDTKKWSPNLKIIPEFDFLIYDKIRWKGEVELINIIKAKLDKLNLTYTSITYGNYIPNELIEKVAKCKSVIFLCEHETQGLAYQQILATNTPVLAYDQEDLWLDPAFYPDKVKFGPVSSVPYWDDKCGVKFKNIDEFDSALDSFQNKLKQNKFNPRKYIETHLTLKNCALAYYNIYKGLSKN